jgi:hypothetical protein
VTFNFIEPSSLGSSLFRAMALKKYSRFSGKDHVLFLTAGNHLKPYAGCIETLRRSLLAAHRRGGLLVTEPRHPFAVDAPMCSKLVDVGAMSLEYAGVAQEGAVRGLVLRCPWVFMDACVFTSADVAHRLFSLDYALPLVDCTDLDRWHDCIVVTTRAFALGLAVFTVDGVAFYVEDGDTTLDSWEDNSDRDRDLDRDHDRDRDRDRDHDSVGGGRGGGGGGRGRGGHAERRDGTEIWSGGVESRDAESQWMIEQPPRTPSLPEDAKGTLRTLCHLVTSDSARLGTYTSVTTEKDEVHAELGDGGVPKYMRKLLADAVRDPSEWCHWVGVSLDARNRISTLLPSGTDPLDGILPEDTDTDINARIGSIAYQLRSLERVSNNRKEQARKANIARAGPTSSLGAYPNTPSPYAPDRKVQN